MKLSAALFQVFRVLPCVLVAGLPLGLHAGIVAQDTFSYANGSLVTNSAGAWTTHSGNTGETPVVSGRVVLDRNLTEDVNILLAGQPYTSGSATKLYVSFTVNFTTLPTGLGEYFAHVKGSSTSNFRAKVFAFSAGAGAGQFRLGLSSTNNSPTVTNTTVLTTNTDYRVYFAYTLNSGVAQLWVDPTNEASASVTATDAATATSIIAFALRQDNGIGVLQMDDLRVGTSFADVYAGASPISPSITQQPASTSAVEGGTATFVAVATGSAPLSYQWKFNTNTVIAGATNATFTLTNVTLGSAGQYSLTVTNAAGATNSLPATLTVITPNPNGTVSLVHYNVKGNFATNWVMDMPQLQAIGRELAYLNPDIITFNEIPYGKTYEMTNFINIYLPGYFMVTNSGVPADVIRSVIMSRYPITRSQAWLSNASLTNFGFAGTFTRDLFEAEITVPGASEPLHVFTTHLKSAEDADSQDRRAAEANCISNFLVTAFIPSNGYRPYVLTGDLNEDVNIPMSHNNQPIQHLTAVPTGLHLTTPLNPFTLERFTHSIQGVLPGSMDARFDYILPAGVLSSNIVASQVFRTDKLPPPLPLNLNSNDDIIASDHLPVQMIFNYPDPPLRLTLTTSNQSVVLHWPALIGRRYRIETSTNFTAWSVTASNLLALAGQQTWTATASGAAQFYRVVRGP